MPKTKSNMREEIINIIANRIKIGSEKDNMFGINDILTLIYQEILKMLPEEINFTHNKHPLEKDWNTYEGGFEEALRQFKQILKEMFES